MPKGSMLTIWRIFYRILIFPSFYDDCDCGGGSNTDCDVDANRDGDGDCDGSGGGDSYLIFNILGTRRIETRVLGKLSLR